MYSRQDIDQWLTQRKQMQCHRQLIVLSGSEQWGIQTAQYIIQALEPNINNNILSVGLPSFISNISNNEYRQFLGQEFNVIIYNTWTGIRANAMSALSGAVAQSGVMLLLCPDFNEWPQYHDPELNLRVSHGFNQHFKHSVFIQWLILRIQSDNDVNIIRESSNIESSLTNSVIATPKTIDESISPCITPDQNDAVEAIIKVATGHRSRPMVMQADRGRGKSTSIGIAASILSNQFGKNIIITAPHKRNCLRAFKIFEELESNNNNLTFWAPDSLIENTPNADLIVVDEAAALPVEILKRICQHYRRIVFSTTIHGYEGSGRGFEIRFKDYLKHTFPNYKEVHLKTPIRWQEHDSLERFWFESLCYLPLSKYSDENTNSSAAYQLENFIGVIDKDQLLQTPDLLFNVFSLLINAHYQTSPDTFSSMLDSPEASIFILLKEGVLVATAITMHEGGKHLQSIADDIAVGNRRPNGHLLAQKLGYLSGEASFVHTSYLRIVRVAVKQEDRRQGYGSRVIKTIVDWAKTNNTQFVGASFGAESKLLAFWIKNRFELVNLGHKKETATGEHNAVVLCPIDKSQGPLLSTLREIFERDIKHNLGYSFKYLSIDILMQVLKQRFSISKLNEQQNKELKLFSHSSRILDMTAEAISALVLSLQNLDQLMDKRKIELLLKYAIQRHSSSELSNSGLITGKKDLEIKLREIVGILITERETH